jgi:hypothetical protein
MKPYDHDFGMPGKNSNGFEIGVTPDIGPILRSPNPFSDAVRTVSGRSTVPRSPRPSFSHIRMNFM